MAYLILVRHGKSEWNKLGLWTGRTDVNLAPEGVEEARAAGRAIRDIPVHHVFISALRRTAQTFAGIAETHTLTAVPVVQPALNERHYGIYTGKNKWEVKQAVGDTVFQNMRRGWNVPIPEGETLKDVYERVVPFYRSEIEPKLKDGENVLIVAHGNSLRALAKHLEAIDDAAIGDLEIGTGEVHCYRFDGGIVCAKEIRSAAAEIRSA